MSQHFFICNFSLVDATTLFLQLSTTHGFKYGGTSTQSVFPILTRKTQLLTRNAPGLRTIMDDFTILCVDSKLSIYLHNGNTYDIQCLHLLKIKK